MKIFNTTYNIESNINKKIVLISDLHYYNKKNIFILNKVLDKIKIINPDYVCIAGDIIDHSTVFDLDLLIDWLIKLSSFYKTIVVIGNHEYYVNKKDKIYNLDNSFIEKISNINNLYFLNNKSIIIDNINFIGLDLGKEYYINNSVNININTYIKKDCYNILLCHSPMNIDKIINNDIDLVLCGHMHGGLVPKIFRKIIKNYGIIDPNKKLFPKYVYGLKNINKTNLITTSGITVLSHSNLLKFLNFIYSSEIVIINF